MSAFAAMRSLAGWVPTSAMHLSMGEVRFICLAAFTVPSARGEVTPVQTRPPLHFLLFAGVALVLVGCL